MLSSTLLAPLAVFYVSYLSSATCTELLKRHRRALLIASFTVDEGYQGPFPYELGKIRIKETIREHIDLFGEGVDEEPKGLLFFNKTSATVYVLRPVDYEQKNKLMLKLKSEIIDLSSNTRVRIIVRDSNDNPPRFQQALYEIEVSEEKTQVEAQDRDEVGSPNSMIDYDIKSVSPDTRDVEFSINGSGSISFKGCLDREAAENVTLLVEAKDRGEVLRLSSSTTVVIHVQDANDHVPIIRGQKGSGTVKEGEVGLSPLRLLVTDQDKPHMRAWRARYTIEGDEAGNFRIETDPASNDGILTVIKPLDFERAAEMQLSIRVENEVPYFSCRVKEKMQSGLWKVDTSTDAGVQPQSFKVLIKVEDVNDPPEFSVGVKEVRLEENVPIGTWVEKFTASDPDSTFVYSLESDPAGWLSVDPLTGDIRTVKLPDRESYYVVNGVYTVLVTAVDYGDPPMTGTATLNIQLTDQNDNAPRPAVDRVNMCLFDSPVTADIPVHDPDGHPFNGPFSFELKNDFDGKWKLKSLNGYSAGLVKEANVHGGVYKVTLKINDLQGKFGLYDIEVFVCDCVTNSNCERRRVSVTASGAIIVAFATLLLFLSLLLLVSVSSKKTFVTFEMDDIHSGSLVKSNTAMRGTDCTVVRHVATKRSHVVSCWEYSGQWQGQKATERIDTEATVTLGKYAPSERKMGWFYGRENIHQSVNTEKHKTEKWSTPFNMNQESHRAVYTLIQLKHSFMQKAEEDAQEYHPHPYADEGDAGVPADLDVLAIPDDSAAFQGILNNLTPEFSQLASICMQQHFGN